MVRLICECDGGGAAGAAERDGGGLSVSAQQSVFADAGSAAQQGEGFVWGLTHEAMKPAAPVTATVPPLGIGGMVKKEDGESGHAVPERLSGVE